MSRAEKNNKSYNATRFRKLLYSKLNSSKSSGLGGEFLLNRDNSDLMIHILYLSFIDELITEASKNLTGPGSDGEITEQRIDAVKQKVMDRYKA